jgi:hypothetical protein
LNDFKVCGKNKCHGSSINHKILTEESSFSHVKIVERLTKGESKKKGEIRVVRPLIYSSGGRRYFYFCDT